MKFLKKSKRWMKAHWQNKSFRIFLAVNILLAVVCGKYAAVFRRGTEDAAIRDPALRGCGDRMHRPEEQTDPERDPAGTGVYSGVGIDRGMCNVSVVCAVHDHIRTSRKYPGRRYVPDLLFYYKGRCRHG